jgi:serine/threonine protein kinase
LQNIRNGNWSFGDRLSHVTPDAKDFITRLLVTDQQNRLTSEQALNHPWLKYALQHADAPAIASDRLQGAYSRQLYEVSVAFLDELCLKSHSSMFSSA